MQALALRNATGLPVMYCKKALRHNDGDLVAAKKWLEEGAWTTGMLISWDHVALDKSAQQLHLDTGHPVSECKTVLMKAGGNVETARRRLTSGQ